MACLQNSELKKESIKTSKMWKNSKSIQKYGWTDNDDLFKRLFDTATGKPFLNGVDINAEDMKKMQVAIEDLETDLKSPGALSNKILKSFYVGSAKAMRHPVLKNFYDQAVNANEYRNRNTQNLMAHYKDFVSNIKLSLIEGDGINTSNMDSGNIQARDVLNASAISDKRIAKAKISKLETLENAYIQAVR